MPLFRRTDPDLRSLVAYVVARARAREITLNRTKLVKLLYLIDVERARSRRDALTGLHWVFFHYGPYALELQETLEGMEGRELTAQPWHGNVLYRSAPGAPDGIEWPAGTKSTVDHVVDEFGSLDLKELLDYVYFHTGPMKDARRGDHLDLQLARGDRRTSGRPLAAPPAPPDVEERLELWRRKTRQRLSPVSLDPPGAVLTVDEDEAVEEVKGRLHVPDGTEL